MYRCNLHIRIDDIRMLHSNTYIKDEFLICKPITTITKAVDIFDILNSFFIANDLEWNKLMLLITDGTPSMLGITSGLFKFIKDKSPEVILIYCLISLSRVLY